MTRSLVRFVPEQAKDGVLDQDTRPHLRVDQRIRHSASLPRLLALSSFWSDRRCLGRPDRASLARLHDSPNQSKATL